MNDLKREYLMFKKEIDDSLSSVLSSGRYIGGKVVEEFERSWAHYLDTKHIISCANGTDALLIAYMALGLKPGDEVIMPAYGYIAAAESAVLLGLRPVLVDIALDYNIDVTMIEEAISPRTKAILPIHLFGRCADMTTILEIAQRYQLYVIEDAAQVSGGSMYVDGEYIKAGTAATVGCYSHFPSKHLGCFGDGGSICTHDDELASKIRRLKKHGQKSKYIHQDVGLNSRLDAMQAAILLVKLKYLDQQIKRRQMIAQQYSQRIKSDILVTPAYDECHTYHQYPTMVIPKQRNHLIEVLKEYGIASSIYYPLAISDQPAMKDRVTVISDDNARRLAQSNLSLPISPTMEQSEVDYICDIINHKS